MRRGIQALACGYSLAIAIAAFGALSARDARACAIPVYRYALENWPPEAYLILNFHRGALNAADEALAKSYNETHINAAVIEINVDTEVPQEFKSFWEANKTKALPLMVLVAPANTVENPVLWTGAWSKENLDRLVHTPLRKKLTTTMETGTAGVWVLFDGADKAANDALMDLFEKSVRELSERFTADVKANSESMPGEPDSPEHPAPEAVKLAVIRASRKDVADDPLFSGLLREQMQKDDPSAILVFGRGRMLGPLSGKGVKADDIESSTGFLTGPCMCSIKEQRIGVDLLLDLDSDLIKKNKVPLEVKRAPEPVETAAPPSAVNVQAPEKTTPAAPLPTVPTPPLANTPAPVPPATAPAAVRPSADAPSASAFSSNGLVLAGILIVLGVAALVIASKKGSAS